MLLRGLKCDLFEPVPVLEDIGDIARRFFCQNGFRSIQDVDNHGWMPLHYAAVCGDGALVQSLLALEADPNQPTQKANPSLGLEARVLPLSLSCFFGHNDVVQLLISSKSTLISKAMVYRPLHSAAGAGNKEAVRMLCEASCRLEYNSLGLSALQAASFQPAVEVVDELLGHARAATLDVSEGLYYAVLGFAGSEMIYRLVEMKADVNIQSDQHWRRTPLVRAVYLAKYLQHRFYKATPLSRCCYHAQGATPLMFAMLNSNHECAAALIASGARLDLRNWRGCTAADLARHHFLPDFLKEAFEGRVEACRRVALLARGFVEEKSIDEEFFIPVLSEHSLADILRDATGEFAESMVDTSHGLGDFVRKSSQNFSSFFAEKHNTKDYIALDGEPQEEGKKKTVIEETGGNIQEGASSKNGNHDNLSCSSFKTRLYVATLEAPARACYADPTPWRSRSTWAALWMGIALVLLPESIRSDSAFVGLIAVLPLVFVLLQILATSQAPGVGDVPFVALSLLLFIFPSMLVIVVERLSRLARSSRGGFALLVAFALWTSALAMQMAGHPGNPTEQIIELAFQLVVEKMTCIVNAQLGAGKISSIVPSCQPAPVKRHVFLEDRGLLVECAQFNDFKTYARIACASGAILMRQMPPEERLAGLCDALIRSHLENKESYRMQQLLQFLRKELPKSVPLPDEKNIRYFIENERKR
eukprot:s1644_g1.t2